MQPFVDDPESALRGTRTRHRAITYLFRLYWLAFGFDLVFKKAVRGRGIS